MFLMQFLILDVEWWHLNLNYTTIFTLNDDTVKTMVASTMPENSQSHFLIVCRE